MIGRRNLGWDITKGTNSYIPNDRTTTQPTTTSLSHNLGIVKKNLVLFVKIHIVHYDPDFNILKPASGDF